MGKPGRMLLLAVPRSSAPALPPLPCPFKRPQTARGDGLQQEVEWLAYASLLRNLSATGVPEELVWDVPGAPAVPGVAASSC